MIAVTLVVAGCSSEPEELSGFVRTPAPNVASASLPDVSNGGTDFAMQAAAGEILILYFGYTSCPDVCPTTLADLRSALGEAGDIADRVQVAMATVDLERDTDEVLTGYVQSFIPDAHALRANGDDELRAAAEAVGADYDVTVTEDGKYEVFHTALLYAIDDAGLLQVTWAFGTEPESIARDLGILLSAK